VKKNRPYIIIGMHRSGTSFLSRALDAVGIYMGAVKDRNNESKVFIRINEHAMTRSGYDWCQPGVPRQEHWVSRSQAFIAHVRHFGSLKRGETYRRWLTLEWGWKDPRNTYTLAMWLKMFPEAKVINIYRNGLDVALSLAERNEKLLKTGSRYFNEQLHDLAFNLRLWEQYTEKALSYEAALRSRMITLRYESLVAGAKDEVRKLEDFTGKRLEHIIRESAIPNKRPHQQSNREELRSVVAHNPLMERLGYL